MEVGIIQRNENTKKSGIVELLKHKDSLMRKGEKSDFNEYHKGHPSEAIT